MKEKEVAFKVVERYLKDKRTKEMVKKKFIYADMERASLSEKEIIQMHISSGYELKKWNSIKKERGITAEMILQYLKNQENNQNLDLNTKNKIKDAKDNFIKGLESNTNFMTIVGKFNKELKITDEIKKEIKEIVVDETTVSEIGNIRKTKILNKQNKAETIEKANEQRAKVEKEIKETKASIKNEETETSDAK